MATGSGDESFDILLIEDNAADTLLVTQALSAGRLKIKAHSVRQSFEALSFLRSEEPYADFPRPDLILLDLASTNMHGQDLIGEIKSDSELRRIPLVVLTTSRTREDVQRCYDQGANCCIVRPPDWTEFERSLAKTLDFWLSQATLPSERFWARQPESARILLIEDNPADVRWVKEMLRDGNGDGAGFVVTVAATLQAGTEQMSTEKFDAVLLDLTLPDGKGLECLGRVSAQASRVPILVLTGNKEDAEAKSAMRQGAQDFLVKGQCDGTALKHALQNAIDRSGWRNYTDQIAHHDNLTRLPNRALFQDRLRMALEQARRNNKALAVLYLDLDRFKTINDTLGHAVGDLLLECVAKRLKAAVRASDTVARVGGDEFTLLLPDITALERVFVVGDKILSAVRAPYLIGPHQVHTSASIGASLYPGDGEDAETLIKNADAALNRAKQQGRNVLEFHSRPGGGRFTGRGALAEGLREAIEKRQFLLHYQPTIDTLGKVVGMEALVRWRHPEWGLLYPLQFIPIAEDTGMILDIGEWVLTSACTDRRSWHNGNGTKIPRVSINLSNRQLYQGRFLVDSLARALSEYRLDPTCLEVEVTENALAQDENVAMQTLQEVKDLGISIALDDYGTGYSSLARLKRFPIHSVKIDRSFIHNVAAGSDEATLVTAMIAVGHGLKLHVTAEGVETGDQMSFLVDKGIDEMQGHYIGKPVPAGDCQGLLDAGPIRSS
ncbi:MAG TPA: EAL domain-containing protein [Candidatus Polarisedimenticolia bacterium]|jgi:diguanylate cyclase (GGDEF)-like protein|nr:EAL domain-containing protein [Candidatus Polarisedimenticolia bacterium]